MTNQQVKNEAEMHYWRVQDSNFISPILREQH